MAKTPDKNGGPNHLKAWRLANKDESGREMTQEALALKAETSTNMIQYLESGERGLSLKWLRRLAPALNTTVPLLAEYDPGQVDAEALKYFTKNLTVEQQAQLVKMAETLLKTGTNDT